MGVKGCRFFALFFGARMISFRITAAAFGISAPTWGTKAVAFGTGTVAFGTPLILKSSLVLGTKQHFTKIYIDKEYPRITIPAYYYSSG